MNSGVSAQERGRRPGKRVMALDLGEKRIGVAISDETRTLARSLTVLMRKSRLKDYERIGRIADEQGIMLVVVGLPLLNSGQEGEKAAWVRDYSADLERRLALPVTLWDEGYTTVRAEASLRERGIHGRRRRQRVDAAAAAFILQSYLDAQAAKKSDEGTL
ncbi:MAG: Holliday junction resolvase RuvX [Candidatus Promineifilaceae bacterium]